MALNENDKQTEAADQTPGSESEGGAPESAPDASSGDGASASASDSASASSVTAPAGNPGAGAPGWVVPAYVAGLVLLYIGERILQGMPAARWAATGAGLALLVVATATRFIPKFQPAGERRQIERVLAVLSVTGLLALGLYFITTDYGAQLVGLANARADVRERIEGILAVSWVIVLAVSVIPMLFAESALRPMRQAERPESRRVRAAAASGLTLVVAAVYGALFVFAADGFNKKVDYSYFKTSRPSDSTRNVAKSLKDPIQVLAFFPHVSEAKSEVERYLRDLADGMPKMKVEFHDRLLTPKMARELHVNSDGVIVLKRGDTTERLEVGAEMEAARKNLKTLDRDFQERLMKMVRSRRVAYLTVGHGEINDKSGTRQEAGRAGRIVRMLLEKQNYQVKDLGLSQGLGREVPDDASIVLVLGPTEPFTPEEIGTLGRYVENGGKLFLALDPDGIPSGELGGQVELAAGSDAKLAPGAAEKKSGNGNGKARPAEALDVQPALHSEPAGGASLGALARLVGLEFGQHVLAHDEQHLRRRFNDSDRTMLMTNRFSSHASVSTLSRNSSQAAVVVFGTSSLERQEGAQGTADFTIRSLPGTFADANRNYQPDDGEKRTMHNIAAAVTIPSKNPKPPEAEPKAEKKDEKNPGKKDPSKDKPDASEARAFVLADADALTDLVMSNVVGNQVLLVDAVRWLGGEESFAGQVNTEEDVRIEHTKQKDLVWFYSTIFGAPALVLGLGLMYSRRTRRARGGKR